MLITIPGTNFSYDIPSWVCYSVGIAVGYAVVVSTYMSISTKRHRIDKSLKNKVIVITGGTSRIGKACVQELAKHGATIHILARDMIRGEKLITDVRKSTGNQNLFVHYINLSDFNTVQAFAKKFLATDTKIHILINNAALINVTKKLTVDGVEEDFQANYLSHFLLTNLLLDRMISSRPSRIINVSSEAYTLIKDFDPKDMNWSIQPYDGLQAYALTKFEMILWTRELARRLYGKRVTVNSVHPGGVRTSILRNLPLLLWIPWSMIFWLYGISAHLGAQTILYLATSDEVENVSGYYFFNCRPEALKINALNDLMAVELWKESGQLVSKWK